MKLTIYSNFFNHHQESLCNEFYRILGEDFHFVATTPVDKERLSMGYEDSNRKYPYIIRSYENQSSSRLAYSLALESDAIIIGSAPLSFIKERLKRNKLTFIYSERFYKNKNGFPDIRWIKYFFIYHYIYRNRVHILSSGAYLANDLSSIGIGKEKIYKWGYFPKTEIYDWNSLKNIKNNTRPRILWVGRMIPWKHPELAIHLAMKLRSEGLDFELRMIGTGKLREKLVELIKINSLSNFVEIAGPLPHRDIRKEMERSNIFLFTSDSNEGWGAVLNEAMNSGCAVVADMRIGAVPYLLKQGVNGYIYSDFNELQEKVVKLICDKELTSFLGINAINTISKHWSPKVAASNFLKLVNGDLSIINEPCEKLTK